MKVSLTLVLCSLGMGGRPMVSLGGGIDQGGMVNCGTREGTVSKCAVATRWLVDGGWSDTEYWAAALQEQMFRAGS